MNESWSLSSGTANTVGLIAEGEPDCTVNWGDGSVERVVSSNGNEESALHTYTADAVYRVAVSERPNYPATPLVMLVDGDGSADFQSASTT